jgi:hypothetical protein
MSTSERVNEVSRRRFLRAAITASAAATAGRPTTARSQERDEIVIGFQNDLTGLLASYGYWYDKTAKAAIARINGQGGIAGKKVRLVSEDTESNVNLGVRKLRKLIEEDKADVVLGSLHSGIEEAKWKTRADNARLIRALENMKMEEGIEFPQGPKEIRPPDNQAFLEFYLSRINDKGGVDVVRKIDRKQSVYPVNPPGTDYTKEQV